MNDDNIPIYKEIDKYPVLDDMEQLELLDKYRDYGDQEARQKLINHNLRLCLFVAKKYIKFVKNMTFMELFDENVITLMKAIEQFQKGQGAKLSSYVISAMENNLHREINVQDDTIRKPEYVNNLIASYHNMVNTYNNQYNREPTQEEFKEKLQLDDHQLKRLQATIKNENNISSLDSLVRDDESKTNLIDLIPANEKAFDYLNDQFDLNILKNKCLKILTKEEYYIIYYRYLSDDRLTLKQIATEFGVTAERIRQKQTKIYSKLKRGLAYVKENNLHYREELHPLRIHYIMILNELKQLLPKEEYFILYSFICGKESNQYEKILGLNSKQRKEMEQYLMNIFNYYLEEDVIVNLSNKYRARYTVAQILDLDIKVGFKDLLDFRQLDLYFQSIELEDIERTEYYKNCTIHEKKLIRRYYKKNNDILVSSQINLVERELTLNKLGYIKKEKSLYSINELKKLYDKYEELLTDKQKQTLQLILFSKEKNTLRPFEIEGARNSLIKKELQIDHFFNTQITLSQIKEVIKKEKNILTPREMDIIFKFYGLGTKKMSIDDIASYYHESYDKIHDELANLRERLLKSYYNISEYKKDDLSEENKKLYKLYMENAQYEFSDEIKRIFSMYLNGKNYEEISKLTHLSRIKVSNVVTDGLRKCEFYQYGILVPTIISKDDIDLVFHNYSYSDIEKQLVNERFLFFRQPKELKNKYHLDSKKIINLNSRFYTDYLFLKCPKISIEEYIEELNKHPSESVLTEDDKKLISLEYGIPSRYNLSGEKKSIDELLKIYSISKRSYLKRVKTVENKMREKIIGLVQPKYGIIPRNELVELLKDENLPISEKERKILCSINELNGYTYKTEQELAEQYEEQPSSIRRRYNRAILSIKKYQDNIILKQISYEKDIKPIEKYFGEYDRRLLIMYYKNKMTNEQMAKELKLTYNQIQIKTLKLRLSVSEILNDEMVAKKFDFDYAREVLNNSDLPLYYNNNELVIRIYQMLSGELGDKKYTQKEVIEKLHLDVKESSVNRMFYDVLLAVEKYKRGIRKPKTVNMSQVISFYEENNSTLQRWDRDAFERLIKEEDGKDTMLRLQKNFSQKVIYEIVKSQEAGCVKINSIKNSDAIKILSNRNLILSSYCRRNIKNYFHISERDLMSGKEKMKVLKLLSPMYQKISTNKKFQKV